MKFLPIISALHLCLLSGCMSRYVFQPVASDLSRITPVPVVSSGAMEKTPPVAAASATPPISAPIADPPPTALPDNSYAISVKAARVMNGRVVNAPPGTGVAVVNFPIGQLPEMNRTLSVYRNGVKVGKLLMTGPQRDDNVAAEIVEGDVRPGDEARDR